MGMEGSSSYSFPGRLNEGIVTLCFMSSIAALTMTRVIDDQGQRIPIPPLGPHTTCLNLLLCFIPVSFCASMSAIAYHPNFPTMARICSEIAPIAASMVLASFVAIVLPDGFQVLPYVFPAFLLSSALQRAYRALLPLLLRRVVPSSAKGGSPPEPTCCKETPPAV